jgi:hypothetical protein
MLPPSSGLVFTHLTTWRNNPKNHDFYSPPWKHRIMQKSRIDQTAVHEAMFLRRPLYSWNWVEQRRIDYSGDLALNEMNLRTVNWKVWGKAVVAYLKALISPFPIPNKLWICCVPTEIRMCTFSMKILCVTVQLTFSPCNTLSGKVPVKVNAKLSL